MNSEVQPVYKNLRYRIMTIGEDQYILDLGRSFWKFFFPFFFWMLPNPVFKINDNDIVEKLKAPEVKQVKVGAGSVLLGGGISVILADLLYPLTKLLDIQSPKLVNSVIVIIVLIIVLALCLYLSNRFRKNLNKRIMLEELSIDKLWIRPNSIKHFFKISLLYLLFLALTFMFVWLYIDGGNVFILFGAALCFLFFLSTNALTVMIGNTRVKFMEDRKTAI